MPVLNPIHHLLQKEPTLVFPGVYDALGAKLVERAGFPLTFISGYSVAATQLGLPDFGYLTQTEMVAMAKRVCGSVRWSCQGCHLNAFPQGVSLPLPSFEQKFKALHIISFLLLNAKSEPRRSKDPDSPFPWLKHFWGKKHHKK